MADKQEAQHRGHVQEAGTAKEGVCSQVEAREEKGRV